MDTTSTDRSPKRFEGYVAELKTALAKHGLGSGRARDLVPVANALRAPGSVKDGVAAAILSIASREPGGLTRAQVASMLVVAVGGTGLYVTAQEVDAVGRLDEFVDWVMAPAAKVALVAAVAPGGDAVAQAVEPFWGIVGAAAEAAAAVKDRSKEIGADGEEIKPQAVFDAAVFTRPPRSRAPWIAGACAAAVLVMVGLVWRSQQAVREQDAARAPEMTAASVAPDATPAQAIGMAQGAGQGSVRVSGDPGSAVERAFSAANLKRPMKDPAGETDSKAEETAGVSSLAAIPLAGRAQVVPAQGVPPQTSHETAQGAPPAGGSGIAVAGRGSQAARPGGSVAAPAPGVGPSGRFVVSSGVMSGHLITAPEPAYPKMAKMWGVEGEVVLQAVVSRKGQVVAVHAMDGHKLLRGAAENSVKKWRYRPYMQNGKATDVDTVVIVDFHLPS